MTIEIGDKIEGISGITNQGEWALSDYLGKKLVIYFYPRDNTPGCTTESKEFNERYAEFQALNCEIVGVSMDDLKSHQKFIDKYDFQFPLIADVKTNICNIFNVYKLKKFMGKEYMGIERSTFLINENGFLEKEWRKVKVKGHVEEVLSNISQLTVS